MIRARGLTHRFRQGKDEFTAVDGIDLDVAPGEFVGFLGPNGAGKTTTMRILTTLLKPTAGEATIAGCDLRADSAGVRRRIGYSTQTGGAGPDCLVGEELAHHGRLHAIPKAAAQQRANELLDRLDLHGLGGRRVDTLSGGQRRRLDIAMG
ncbi:ABC-2 type transport system ATP-binding protein [Actinoalloteichus hymeniacidonis]|uniref:ABC transporter n=1 Tax=Actinoalloteichus hymeniacidonis TaxID=340345 RepID=A0AAC9HML4_9PSEU|nr:ABC transporter [Actinoalloteichus hymeniacidonis]MBB5910456.1 ABC-2 type transport system ATP-binding protein [Actinoalloteichus hymeniacidonis]